MRLFSLVLVNLARNKVRTTLTFLSVVVALFLFCALNGVLDTLEDSIRVGSEQRLVTRNAVSLVFPLPLAYLERIRAVDGVRQVSWGNWFGGRDPANERDFFAQFAVDAETYLEVYARDIEIVAGQEVPGVAVPAGLDPKLAAFLQERTGALVGQKLFERKGWKLGQTVPISGTIFPGTWPLTVRAVYHAKDPAFGEESMLFHWKYLDERIGRAGQIGWYVLDLSDPNGAGRVTQAVDAMFANSSAATRTETERAFQAGFVSMYGNIPFLIRVIGFAVVFAILLVAANTMMMATRERTSEYGVLKTLGFDDGTVFRLVLIEAAILTLFAGAVGALLAKWVIERAGFNMGGFLPPMSVHWSTVALGIGVAVVMGAASGLIPAWQASKLRIVDALRRVQ